MAIFSKNFGGAMAPLAPPDYAYASSRRSVWPPLVRGPIGSNRSNRLKAGPALAIFITNNYLLTSCNGEIR